jgi:hypothetical protein
VWLVAFALKDWRERNGRKRVPSDITNEIITAAIIEAARVFNVPETAISESNIRNLLKNRTVVVH